MLVKIKKKNDDDNNWTIMTHNISLKQKEFEFYFIELYVPAETLLYFSGAKPERYAERIICKSISRMYIPDNENKKKIENNYRYMSDGVVSNIPIILIDEDIMRIVIKDKEGDDSIYEVGKETVCKKFNKEDELYGILSWKKDRIKPHIILHKKLQLIKLFF